MKLRLKIVAKPNGKRYVYHRTTMLRLPDLPFDSAGFLAAYAEAESARKPQRAPTAAAGTVAALCLAYQRSDDWRALRASTQGNRRRIMAKIAKERGAALVAGLRQVHIETDLKPMSPAASVNRLKCWRAMLAFAVRDGWIPADPSATVKRRRYRATPRAPWPAEAIARFRAHWAIGTPERLAFEAIAWTGARCSDARRFGAQMIDASGWLCFAQQKTGGEVAIPIFAPLPARLSALESERQMLLACLRGHGHMLWIVTRKGAPRSEKAISAWVAEAARAADCDFTAHGLRKNRAISLAELGEATHQIGAWTGHESLAEIEGYTKGARRRLMIEGDVAKLRAKR